VNDEEYYDRVKIIAGIISPELVGRVGLYNGEEDIFEYYHVETRVENCWRARFGSKRLVYRHRPDGSPDRDRRQHREVYRKRQPSGTLFETNCEAAKEIARQIRLRDISGIIVIDFIDMEGQENKDALVELLRSCLKNDGQSRTSWE
jgi:ribonuclease G